MARDDWDGLDASVSMTGDIEFVVVWGFDGDGNPETRLRVNVQLLDVDGNDLGRKYVRDTEKVEKLLTVTQRTGIDALGDRFRSKADTKFVPA